MSHTGNIEDLEGQALTVPVIMPHPPSNSSLLSSAQVTVRPALTVRRRAAPYTGLNGRGYTLNGGTQRFRLPEVPSFSRSDGLAGGLSVWPAKADCIRDVSASSIKPKSLAWHRQGKPQHRSESGGIGAKPKFLLQLEEFVDRELFSLGGSVAEPSAARLAVYREAFHHFMEDFRTYKPILSAIQNEYEMLLDKYSRRLHFIPPLKARLCTLQRETDEALGRMSEEHESYRLAMQSELATLRSECSSKDSLIHELRTNVKGLEIALEREATKFSDVKGMSLSLISGAKRRDMELIALQREKLGVEEAMHNEMLNMGANIARLERQLFEKQGALDNALLRRDPLRQVSSLPGQAGASDGGDMREMALALEALKAEHSGLVATTSDLAKARSSAVAEVEMARTAVRKRLEEFSGLAGQFADASLSRLLEQLFAVNMKSARGREDFNLLRDVPSAAAIAREGSTEKTKRKKLGRGASGSNLGSSTATLPSVAPKGVVTNSIKQDDKYSAHNPEAFFKGQGLGDSVPPYLRISGLVPNWKLSKRVTERVVKECWIEKEKAKDIRSLDYFFADFLLARHGDTSVAASWGYNLVSALQRYSYDGDCDLFLQILQKELHEDVVSDQIDDLGSFQEELARVDRLANGKESGSIPRGEFFKVLRKHYPLKNKANISSLERIVYKGGTSLTAVNYQELFVEDRDGNQTEFCECLRTQYLSEIREFAGEVRDAVLAAADGEGSITVACLQRALQSVDPHMTATQLRHRLSRAVASDSLETVAAVPTTTVLQGLRNTFLKRSLPPTGHPP